MNFVTLWQEGDKALDPYDMALKLSKGQKNDFQTYKTKISNMEILSKFPQIP